MEQEGSLGRDHGLAAMYPTSAQVLIVHRGCSVCEMMEGGSSAMTFVGLQPCYETAECLFLSPAPISPASLGRVVKIFEHYLV